MAEETPRLREVRAHGARLREGQIRTGRSALLVPVISVCVRTHATARIRMAARTGMTARIRMAARTGMTVRIRMAAHERMTAHKRMAVRKHMKVRNRTPRVD